MALAWAALVMCFDRALALCLIKPGPVLRFSRRPVRWRGCCGAAFIATAFAVAVSLCYGVPLSPDRFCRFGVRAVHVRRGAATLLGLRPLQRFSLSFGARACARAAAPAGAGGADVNTYTMACLRCPGWAACLQLVAAAVSNVITRHVLGACRAASLQLVA